MVRRTLIQLPLAAAVRPRNIAIIAHRGEHLENPENTLPAVRAAIRAGADYVELDVPTTKDGALVLMHNATVDARTNGQGAVRDLTLTQIRALETGGAQVPTFEEALAELRGKCGLYLDWKDASANALLDSLRRFCMLSHTVVYGSVAALSGLRAMEPSIRVMPEAVSAEALRHTLAALHPSVVAFDRRDFQDGIIAIAKTAHAGIFVDRLGEDDNEVSWRDAIRRGATGIQTDRPAELAAFLRR